MAACLRELVICTRCAVPHWGRCEVCTMTTATVLTCAQAAEAAQAILAAAQ
jgi:hypothetical protein